MRTVMLPLLLLGVVACETQVVSVGDGPLQAPRMLTSVTGDNVIELTWSDDSYQSDPDRFLRYTVWSAGYDLDADLCLEPWAVEGTTVAARFTAAALSNSRPRCFRVSAETTDGVVSGYSPIRTDTPRFGSDVLQLWAAQWRPTEAGFRFWRDLDGDQATTRDELGWILDEADPTIDLALDRSPSGELYLTPVRPGVRIRSWPTLVGSITDIDLAPLGGYGREAVVAVPGTGYVVEMDGPDGFPRYGALRVIGRGDDYLYLEYAFQGDPGNPELLRIR